MTRNLHVALLCFFVSWATYGVLHVYPGYIHQDTAEVYMWSQVGYLGGFVKHPPLMAWLFRAVDTVIPLDPTTIAILSAFNLTVGAFAVWKIAELAIGAERAPLALLLHMLSPFVTWQAVKLNHNSVLISFWSLTVLCFLMFRERPTVLRGLLLGLTAGLAVLAKYYSVLLLAAMLVVLLPSLPRLLPKPGTWVALAVSLLVFSPHAMWLYSGYLATMATGSGGANEPGSLGQLLTRNAVNLLPLIAAFLFMRQWLRARPTNDALPEDGRTEAYPIVVLMFVLPYGATLAANLLLGLRGSASWTMPVFTVVPIILAGLLPPPGSAQIARVGRVMAAIALLVIVAGPPIRYLSFKRGDPAMVDPRAEVAAAAEVLWRRAVPGTPLHVVAGDHQYVMTAAVVLASHPRGWTVFSQQAFLPQSEIDRHGFVAICEPTDHTCLQKTEQVSAGQPRVICTVARQRRLWGLAGREFKAVLTLVPPAGQQVTATMPQVCEGL